MKAFNFAVLAAAFIAAAACGESTAPLELPFGLISATVSASTFSADLDSEYSTSNNTLVFSATMDQAVGTYKKISLDIQSRSPVGLLTIGENSPHSVTYTESVAGTVRTWTSAGAGASGTIRIVTINANDATGQFVGTLVPVASTGATGNKTITNGLFEIVF